MHTMVDFITHVKGIEYLLSVSFIAGFLLLWEVLKPKPFKTVAEATREDLEHVRTSIGTKGMMTLAGKIAAAPFIGLAYIIALPIGFVATLFFEVVNVAIKGVMQLAGKSVSFEWRPMEAYFSGKKKNKAENKK